MKLSIEGRSDDTIGAYGLPNDAYSFNDGSDGAMDDYDTCANNDPPLTFDIVTADEGRLRVTAIYNGCWSFAVGLVDEDDPTPDLLARMHHTRDSHSVGIVIDIPDDTKVIWNRRQR